MNRIFDVVVVGAGYSGLCASYHLKKYGLDHLIFERHKIGDSWRTQRWDNFRFNSTNKLNVLPGENVPGDPDKFGTARAFVHELEQYAVRHRLPVQENSKVVSIEIDGGIFGVTVSSNDSIHHYQAKQILIASGAANEIRIPSLAKKVSKNIKQLHTCEYKNADQLPAGSVLVVGGAQSGIQITDDLVNSGRNVFLSTSMVGRIPRWYRGKDIFYWVKEAKFYEVKAEELEDPKLLDQRPPHVTGTGSGKESISLQSLAKKGVVILGKLDHVDGDRFFFQLNAAEHVKFADEFSRKTKQMVDDFIIQNNLTAPAPHHDEADLPDENADCASNIASLDLSKNGIKSIIWATGFDHDHSYIKLPVFDDQGKLKQKNGIADLPGLYFLGYPWQRSRQSPILFGIIEDVEFIVDHIYKYAKEDFTITPSVVT